MHNGRPACIVGDEGGALPGLRSSLFLLFRGITVPPPPFFFIAALVSETRKRARRWSHRGSRASRSRPRRHRASGPGGHPRLARGHGAPRLVPVRNQLRYLCAGVTPWFSRVLLAKPRATAAKASHRPDKGIRIAPLSACLSLLRGRSLPRRTPSERVGDRNWVTAVLARGNSGRYACRCSSDRGNVGVTRRCAYSGRGLIVSSSSIRR